MNEWNSWKFLKNQSLLVGRRVAPFNLTKHYDVLNLLFCYEIIVYTHPGLLILNTPAYKPFIANRLSVKPKVRKRSIK